MSISQNVDAGKSDMEGLLVRSVTVKNFTGLESNSPPFFFEPPGSSLQVQGSWPLLDY
jgi:hypothetical protein